MAFAGIGALFALLGVLMGAFGTHVIDPHLSTNMQNVYQIAVEYQMYHALALIALGILMRLGIAPGLLKVSGWLFSIGIIFFSGSLYGLSMTGSRIYGPITPLGGLLLIIGWVLMAMALFRRSRSR